MKLHRLRFVCGLGAFVLAALSPTSAQDPVAELNALIGAVNAKLEAGADSADGLAAELAGFAALVEKYAGDKSEAVARISLVHAILHLQVLEDEDTGRALLARTAEGFPGTESATSAARVLQQLERAAESKARVAKLIGQPAPEIDFTWSSEGELTQLSTLRGKVVVLDFWATWCGPCVASFPQVRELAEHYKDSPVVVLGVTSLQGQVHGLEARPINTRDDPEREHALMHDYIKAKEITWPIVFSRQEVFNPDYGVEGIPYVAIVAPDGTIRHAGLHPGSPLAEKTEKIDAILREFKLPLPKKS
jgi:thiol-disulfide isomerase/thioredoxin